MSNGYVILANTNIEHREAAACAYSIRIHNPDASISMIVPNVNDVAEQYEEPFENIVELPFDKNIQTRRANDWQIYWASPYENTIAVDCKTIVKEDHTSLWDYLIDHYDLCFPTNVRNYKTERIVNDKRYKDIVEHYSMTMVYSDLFFFRKEKDVVLNYFKLLDPYAREWRTLLNKIFEPHHIPDYYDANIITSIACNHLDILNDVTPAHDTILEYIDMSTAQETIFNKDVKVYTDYINVWNSTNAKLKIQNFAVNTCIAYKESQFLTEEIYNGQRDYFRLNNKQNLVG